MEITTDFSAYYLYYPFPDPSQFFSIKVVEEPLMALSPPSSASPSPLVDRCRRPRCRGRYRCGVTLAKCPDGVDLLDARTPLGRPGAKEAHAGIHVVVEGVAKVRGSHISLRPGAAVGQRRHQGNHAAVQE